MYCYLIMSCIEYFVELHVGYCVYDGTKLVEGHKVLPPKTSNPKHLIMFL